MAKMSDDQLRTLLQQEVSSAVAWTETALRQEQERNLRYYLGMPMGNEVDGRSQVLSWDVFEIVESAMPSFLEPFFSGDTIGEFQPRRPNDEAYSAQATDYVNYLVKDANPGFLIFNTWMKDALISKVGVVRAEWNEEDPKRVEFEGLSDDQMLLLAQDPDSEIIEHTARPVPGIQIPPQNEAQQIMQPMPPVPMLHDVTVLQKRDGCVSIQNVRPERFLISRGAKSADSARCVGELVTYTRSDLKEMGHKDAMTVSNFEERIIGNEVIEQLRDDPAGIMLREIDSIDPTMEEVTLFRGFVKADVNGDGIAEYRQILAGGDTILENEEAEWHDYCVLTPIPIPHRVIGMAYADPAAEIQELKTGLTRQYMDSLYRANNPKTYVNIEASVNLDDLLSTRIGGVVRGRGPATNAVSPLVTTLVSKDALEGVQYADTMRETRLGITRYNQGLDADSLNKTATGVQKIMNAADKRQLMTLRIFAETGIRELFRLVLRIITKYQDRPATVRLRDEWISFDPRGWNPDMDCIVSAGVGSGDKTETLMMLQQFGMFMQHAAQVGVVQPKNVYEFGKMLAKNAKLKGAEDKLLTPPPENPPPPPPPPEVLKAQAEGQVKMHLAHQASQDDLAKKQAELEVQAQNDARDAEREERRMQNEFALEQMRIESAERLRMMELNQAWQIAQLNNAAKIEAANIQSQTKMADIATQAATAEAAQAMSQQQGANQ
jgi:hypothetical protein